MLFHTPLFAFFLVTVVLVASALAPWPRLRQLALLAASYGFYAAWDVRYLGLSEVAIGLVACFYPGYGLIFWAIGFGVLHIFYGISMYIKYER